MKNDNDDIKRSDTVIQEAKKRLEALKEQQILQQEHHDAEMLDAEKLLHELKVNQAELEMQNEELRQAQTNMEVSRNKYYELYDLAPIAYITLSRDSIIQEMNLTASDWFQVERGYFKAASFASFIDPQHIHQFTNLIQNAFETSEKQTGEILFRRRDRSRFWGLITAQAIESEQKAPVCHAAIIDVTQRRKAFDQAHNALNELDQIFNTSTNGMRLIGLHHEVLKMNEAFAKIIGVDRDTVQGKLCYEVFSSPLCETDQCPLNAMKEGKEKLVKEMEIQDKDGDPITIVITTVPFRDKEGNLIGVVEDLVDITQRKRYERKLEASEDRLELALQSAELGLWEWLVNEKGKYELVEFWGDMLGYDTEDSPRSIKNLLALVHPEDKKILIESLSRYDSANKNHLFETEIRLKAKDGQWRWLHSTWRVIEIDDKAKPIKLIGSHHDVSKRKHAELAIAENRKFTDYILNDSADAIFLIDRETMKFVDCNHAAMENLGMSYEEILEIGPIDIKPDITKEALEASFDNVIEGHSNLGFLKTLHQRKDGTTYPVEVLYRVVQRNEKPLIVATSRDISERESAERTFKMIVEGTSATTGRSFFRSLVEKLAGLLNVSFAFAGNLIDDGKRIQSIAVWDKDKHRENFTYDIQGTPCETVIEKKQIMHYPEGVAKQFPEDEMLELMGAESYRGLPLFNSEKEIIGILAVLNNEPTKDEGNIESILKIFAARAGAEIERMDAWRRQREMALFAQHNPWPVMRFNQEGYILTANKAAEAIFDFLLKEDFPNVRDIIPDIASLEFLNLINNAEQFSFETKVGDKMFIFSIVGVPDLGICHIYGHDITQLRRFESERMELFTAINHSADAFAIADRSGAIVYTNIAFSEMTGYSKNEIVGKNVSVILDEEEQDDLLEAFLRVFTEDKVWKGRVTNRRKSGERWFSEISVAPVFDKIGLISRYAIVIRDITEQITAEERLLDAKEKAERAAMAKSQFLSNMSHEIRTPMNGVLGMLSLLVETSLDEEQKEYAETAYSSADALLRVINDILDFSKIEAGKLDLDPIQFNLQRTIEEVADLTSFKTEENNVEMLIRYAPKNPTYVVGDPARFRQILLNLVGNAAKFTEAGHIFINVEALEQTEHQCLFRFSIEDTGIGIPKARLLNIFDSFEQADKSTTRKFGGTGLGLAISKKLVELMGGDIKAESEEGKGSLFTFEIPFITAGDEEAVKPSTIPFGEHMKAFIAVRHPLKARILTERIEAWGGVAEAFSQCEAMGRRLEEDFAKAEKMGEEILRVMIVDFALMNKQDITLLQSRMEEDGAKGRIACITLTPRPAIRQAKQLPSSIFKAHILNPVRPQQLKEAIRAVVEKRPFRKQNITGEFQIDELRRAIEAKHGEPVKKSAFLHVLIAEDNLVNQKVAKSLLEKHHCDVTLANHGQEALAILDEKHFDIIFMDVQMPELDGLATTRAIRSKEGKSSFIPIIAMTAGALQEDKDACLDAGMNDYLSKPINEAELIEKLDIWRRILVNRKSSN